MAAKNPNSTDTTTSAPYVIAKFTSVGTGDYTIPAGVTSVEYLVLGGGGAGYSGSAAGDYADGGHAAQHQAGTGLAVTPGGTVTVTVGAAGAASGGSGGDSVFSSVTSTGGIGGTHRNDNMNLVDGGDGSGGAGAAGSNPYGGNGGAGTSSSITGAAVDYTAGGGAGGYYAGTAGGASAGAGGNANAGAEVGASAPANKGGGGGGGTITAAGGAGGSGVVIIKYLVNTIKSGGVSTGSAGMMCVGM